MATNTSQTPPTLAKLLGVTWMREWLKPRAQDRDEAFRERTIRVTAALVVLIGTLSFGSILFLYNSPWSIISFPTIHVYGLTLCVLSLFFVTRGQIEAAGWLLVATIILMGSGLVILNGQQVPLTSFVTGVGTYTIAIIIATLVLPRGSIIPLVAVCMLIFTAIVTLNQVPGFNSGLLTTLATTMLTAGIFLRQLRVEFDGRLDTMSDLLRQTELAKQHAEEARQQAEFERQRAEQADKTKSQFLANMSHELRTPLNAIIGYDEAMLGGMVGSFTNEQIRLLGNIQHNSRRLLGLINDILDLSKIESGALDVYLSPIAPRKVIQETVESLQSLALEKKIALTTSFTDDVPEVVLGDTKKLQQVLVNLLSNAIKFTTEGEVSVNVSMVDKSNWQFNVKDSGMGMPADAAAYIFEPFRQIDNSETRKFKGTGLGLAITKRLIERLGGTVVVETQLGKGSTFTVKLPRANVPELEDVKEMTA